MSIPSLSYPSLEEALTHHPYGALFLDAYGVFWSGNAQGALPGSQQTMERLFSSGKKICIISNSTQLSKAEIQKYASHGFIQGTHFHSLITSGDIAKSVFSSDTLPFPTPNKKYVLFCPPHPRYSPASTLFNESPFTETNSLSEADFIYINVPHINGENQEDRSSFLDAVEYFLPSKKPMVCANPDCYAQEDSPPRMVVRQGSIAALYEGLGGTVFYFGKPFPHIYSWALQQLRHVALIQKEDVLMVGDLPETDIRGARSFGIHSALVTKTGITAERLARQGQGLLQQLSSTDIPNFFIERFAGSS